MARSWQWPNDLGDFRGRSELFICDEIEVIRESGESWRKLTKTSAKWLASAQRAKNHVAGPMGRRAAGPGNGRDEESNLEATNCEHVLVEQEKGRVVGTVRCLPACRARRHDFPGVVSCCICMCPGHATPHCISSIPALRLLCITSQLFVFCASHPLLTSSRDASPNTAASCGRTT